MNNFFIYIFICKESYFKGLNLLNLSNRSYLINFSIDNLEKFKEDILDFDVDKVMNENNMIIQWIWIIKAR